MYVLKSDCRKMQYVVSHRCKNLRKIWISESAEIMLNIIVDDRFPWNICENVELTFSQTVREHLQGVSTSIIKFVKR